MVDFFSENQEVRGRPDSGSRGAWARAGAAPAGPCGFSTLRPGFSGMTPGFAPTSSGISSIMVGLCTRGPSPFSPPTSGQLIDGVLEIVQVAVQGVQLGPDPVSRIFRALFVRDDEQIVLGDDVKSEAHLIEEQLQTGLESNSIELELNGILGLNGLPIGAARSRTTGALSVCWRCVQTWFSGVGREKGKR